MPVIQLMSADYSGATVFIQQKTCPFTERTGNIGWCRGPESNRYEYLYPRDFKSRASVSSATSAEVMEATPGIEPGIKVLQTSALPLGYVATQNIKGFLLLKAMERKTRLELATPTLARLCSTN